LSLVCAAARIASSARIRAFAALYFTGCWDYSAGIKRQASRRRSGDDGVAWLR
jgi:hypothetical protein